MNRRKEVTYTKPESVQVANRIGENLVCSGQTVLLKQFKGKEVYGAVTQT